MTDKELLAEIRQALADIHYWNIRNSNNKAMYTSNECKINAACIRMQKRLDTFIKEEGLQST